MRLALDPFRRTACASLHLAPRRAFHNTVSFNKKYIYFQLSLPCKLIFQPILDYFGYTGQFHAFTGHTSYSSDVPVFGHLQERAYPVLHNHPNFCQVLTPNHQSHALFISSKLNSSVLSSSLDCLPDVKMKKQLVPQCVSPEIGRESCCIGGLCRREREREKWWQSYFCDIFRVSLYKWYTKTATMTVGIMIWQLQVDMIPYLKKNIHSRFHLLTISIFVFSNMANNTTCLVL